MTLGTKILVAAAVLCLALWFALIGLGVQPLTADRGIDVIYGEGEDFYSDALAYRKMGNHHFIILHFPQARQPYRWASVDFESSSITFMNKPRSLGSLMYRLKSDPPGTGIEQSGPRGTWYWHFTEQGAAFSGDGFSCRVRKTRD